MDKIKAIPRANPEELKNKWTISVTFLEEVIKGIPPEYAGLDLEQAEEVILFLIKRRYLKATEQAGAVDPQKDAGN